MPRGCLQFVIVVFPDHTHLLFFMFMQKYFITYSLLFGIFSRIEEFVVPCLGIVSRYGPMLQSECIILTMGCEKTTNDAI